jgi:fatty acid desaturase
MGSNSKEHPVGYLPISFVDSYWIHAREMKTGKQKGKDMLFLLLIGLLVVNYVILLLIASFLLLIVLLYVLCVCVNVYCTTATRCQPNCS